MSGLGADSDRLVANMSFFPVEARLEVRARLHRGGGGLEVLERIEYSDRPVCRYGYWRSSKPLFLFLYKNIWYLVSRVGKREHVMDRLI